MSLDAASPSSPAITGDPRWSAAVLTTDPEAALLELLLAQAANRSEVEDLHRQVVALRAELALHGSASWRLTAPLRSPAFRKLVRPVVSGASGFARSCSIGLVSEPEQDPALAVPFEWAAVVHPARTRIAAIVHLYYEDLATEIRSYLAQIEEGVDVYISTCTDERAALICDAFKGWASGVVDVRVVPNRGRDIAPKLTAFNDVHSRYEYVLHLHGKRSPHVSVLATWRQFLLENLIGNGKPARSAIAALDLLPSLGMVAAQHFEPVRHWLGWGQNFAACQRLAQRMGFTLDAGAPLDFPSGSMFWARLSALQPIFSLNLTADDFEEEQGQTDGTLAHAIERLFFFACERAGFAWIKIGEPELYASTPRIERVDSPALLQDWFHQTRFKLLAPGEERAVRGFPRKWWGLVRRSCRAFNAARWALISPLRWPVGK